MSTSTLSASRDFVTRLLESLPSFQRVIGGANPLSNAPESVKKQLLSLQILFPNELLPALDLLDRRLVTRFRIGVEESGSPTSHYVTKAPDVQMRESYEPLINVAGPATQSNLSSSQYTSDNTHTVHYVRSAQQRSSRFTTSYDSTTSYEVRLRAWNCTCPAFAFAAFPSLHPEPAVPTYIAPSTIEGNDLQDEDAGVNKTKALEWVFGGVSLDEGMPPVCKHLLACVLAERCSGVFGNCVEERMVSIETAAGWAAGWGDL